jgi:integrase
MTESLNSIEAAAADRLLAVLSPLPLDDRRQALAFIAARFKLALKSEPDSDLPGVPKSEIKKFLSPDLVKRKIAFGMKKTVETINKLIENIRSGQPPKLPEGAREKHYHDPALPGLYIRLLNTGVASWVLQWKRLGRQKKLTIGDVLVLDRPQAIKAAKELLAKMTLGLLDPHEARRERMRANKVTWATVAPLCIEQKIRDGGLRPSTAYYWKLQLVRGYYFKPLHNLPLDEITKDQIQTRIDQIALQSGNNAAETSYGVINSFFKWALTTGKLPEGHRNPMTYIQPPKRNGPRERVLADDEIRLIWKTCEALEAEAIQEQQIMALKGRKGRPRSGPPTLPDYPRAAMLLFLTGCRRQEIGDLQWPEVDLDNGELLIPATRIKTAVELCNPLSDLAVQILRRVERRPDRDAVFGYGNRDGCRLSHLTRSINTHITEAGGTPPKNWRLHDIRRTFRTHLAALGVSMDVAEALLGHIGHRTEVERTYNRYQYWAEKRQALAMWETHLRAIIDGTAEKIARPRFGERKGGGTA